VPNKSKVSTHKNVSLDSVIDDDDLLGPDGDAYCTPARKNSVRYLICLPLQLEKKDKKKTSSFRRIGITKVSPYEGGMLKG
jgi:hypothetical protein